MTFSECFISRDQTLLYYVEKYLVVSTSTYLLNYFNHYFRPYIDILSYIILIERYLAAIVELNKNVSIQLFKKINKANLIYFYSFRTQIDKNKFKKKQ